MRTLLSLQPETLVILLVVVVLRFFLLFSDSFYHVGETFALPSYNNMLRSFLLCVTLGVKFPIFAREESL